MKVKKVIICTIILLMLLYSIYLNVYQDSSILTSIVFAIIIAKTKCPKFQNKMSKKKKSDQVD